MWIRRGLVILGLALASPVHAAVPQLKETTYVLLAKTSRVTGVYTSPEVSVPDGISEVTVRIERPIDPTIIYSVKIEWSADKFATFRVCETTDKGGVVYRSAREGKGGLESNTLITCAMDPTIKDRRARGSLTINQGNHNTAVEITVR